MSVRFTKYFRFVLTLWLIGALLMACQPIRPEMAKTGAASEEQEFTKAALGLEEAYQQEDLERTIAFYADNAVSQPPGYRADVGKAAIKASYQTLYETYNLKRDFKLAGVKIAGNTATRFGEWTHVLTPKAGGDPVTEVGRCVVGFEKINGEWKVVWEIWNTYAAPPQ